MEKYTGLKDQKLIQKDQNKNNLPFAKVGFHKTEINNKTLKTLILLFPIL